MAIAAPEVCERDGGSMITLCPKTCQASCEDTSFVRGSRIKPCFEISKLPASRLRDDERCRRPPAVADCKKFGSSAAGQPVQIPDLESKKGPQPACFQNVDHLNCRLKNLQAQAGGLRTEFGPVIEQKYHQIKDVDDICKLRRDMLEAHFKKSEGADGDFSRIKSETTTEQACMDSALSWVDGLVCGRRGESLCLALNQSFQAKMKNQLKPLLDDLKKINELLDQINTARESIQIVNAYYKLTCSKN